ncbi:MAG: signal peptidase I [Chloroflexota bacterium]
MSLEPDEVLSSPVESNQPGLTSHRTIVRDILEIVLLIVTIYTLVNLATARAVVEGQSMQPNFYTGQLVIVNRFAYFFSAPLRGDVVVLHDPKDPTQDFIKRVMGQPGETIQIKEGNVYANGLKLDEPYITTFCRSGCDGTWTLTDDEYFVLGDNRRNSFDSHSFGPIPRNLIVGQAWIRYWPPSDMGIIFHPRYGDIPKDAPPPAPTADASIIAATEAQ